MTNEDLEFSISQYIDGGLTPTERAALELRIVEDAGARAMLDEYRNLDAAIRSMPLPSVRWDQFSAGISLSIDAAEATREQETRHAFRMPAWIRASVMPLALAASVLIVAGVGIQAYLSSQHSPTGWTGQSTENTSIAKVLVDPAGEKAGPPVIEVAIGPSAEAAAEPVAPESDDDDVVPGSSHVAIASGMVPAHDTASLSSYDME